MKHYARVVDNCTPLLYVFKTKTARTKFLNSFKKKHKGQNRDGWWVDLVFTGCLEETDTEAIKK